MWKSGKLEIGWGFAAMVLLALLAGAGGVLPLVLLSALCHELGHLAALRLAGTEVELLRLTAFGAEIRADTRYLPYPKEILCTLAGPAVNLILALLVARLCKDYLFAGANAILGVYNLLPVDGLDGGRALFLLLSWCTEPFTALRVSRAVNLIVMALLLGASVLLLYRTGGGLFCLLAAAGMAAAQLSRALRRPSP